MRQKRYPKLTYSEYLCFMMLIYMQVNSFARLIFRLVTQKGGQIILFG